MRHSAMWSSMRCARSLGVRAFSAGLPKRTRLVASTRACSGTAHDHSNKFTITTPLYYVNAAPHMGSAYPTIATDAVARYQRLRGQDVTFITGTDEHGEKIALAAAKRGLEPKAHCDDVVASYKELWRELDISYDAFVRTTDAKHEVLVAEMLERAWARGDVYRAAYSGYYCVDCEEYKDEGDMDADKTCPVHRKACSLRQEENWFFALSKYQAALEALLAERPDFVQPESRRNEVLGWVKEGLRDFSISRAAVAWGIPVPRDPRQTVYVWFDALNGYLSGLLAEGQAPSDAALAAAGWPASLHIIGKDILRFHAIYWPAMLMACGLPLPGRVFGHGFLTKDGLKMGKSLGNVLEPRALVGAYGADAVRFYFLREVAFGQDGDFSEERFRNVVNAALANDIGNLLNRTLNLLSKNCGGALPLDAAALPGDHPLRRAAAAAPPAVAGAYERLAFGAACEAALAVSSRGNQYLEETGPWSAFKKGSADDKAAAGAALVAVLEAVRVVAVLLAPVTPALSRRIYAQLGMGEEAFDAMRWEDAAWGTLRAGHATPAPAPVFARLEGDYVTEPAPQHHAAEAAAKPAKQPQQQQKAAKQRAAPAAA